MTVKDERHVLDEAPPLLPGWNAWYALVLGALAVMILFFTWFSAVFS